MKAFTEAWPLQKSFSQGKNQNEEESRLKTGLGLNMAVTEENEDYKSDNFVSLKREISIGKEMSWQDIEQMIEKTLEILTECRKKNER